MIKYLKRTLKDSFVLIRSKRTCVRPNIAFMGQLMAFEEKWHGTCTSSITKFVYNCRLIRMPSFYEVEFPDLYRAEIARQTEGTSANAV